MNDCQSIFLMVLKFNGNLKPYYEWMPIHPTDITSIV